MNTSSLRRKIAVILAVKLIALMGIYWLCFGAAHRVKVDPVQVQTHFYSGEFEKSSGDR